MLLLFVAIGLMRKIEKGRLEKGMSGADRK